MSIVCQEETFDSIKDEVKSLLETHWKELANHQDTRPLDVDWDSYSLMNLMNAIRIFTVRDDAKLIGYFSFYIANNPHYKTWKYASSDVYYLDPAYRKTGTALIMFEEMQAWLKSLGVKSITLQEKIQHSHEKFFTALGFSLVEKVYEKVLD